MNAPPEKGEETRLARRTLIPLMDQRTDNERRQDTAPGPRNATGDRRGAQTSVLDRSDAPPAPNDPDHRRADRIAGIVAVMVYRINTSGYETTDDAFIDARTVSISSQVGAAIVDVPVTDNQLVEPGAVLVRLDDRDYKARSIRLRRKSIRPRPTSPISTLKSPHSKPVSTRPRSKPHRRRRP